MYIVNMTVNEAISSDSLYVHVLHLKTIYDDPSLKCVVKAEGEILERAYLARGKNQYKDIKKISVSGQL